jgi:hypothetical protein
MSAAAFVNGLVKRAEDGDTRQRAKTRADELLNMNSTGGMLADYLTPSLWGGARAGRATQLAQAAGRDVPFSVKHPNTADVSALLAGGTGGAALGGLAGAAMDSGPDGFPLGAVIGGGLGGLASLLAMRSRRRSRMGQIRQVAEDELASGNPLKPVDPNLGTASSVLLPFGGSHRAGQADAYEALRDDAKYPGMAGRNVAYALAPLIGGSPLGMPYAAGMGAYQGLNAQSRVAGEQQSGLPAMTRKAAAVSAWLSDERRREKQGSVKLANIPQLSGGPPELPRRPAPMPKLDESSSAVSALDTANTQLSDPEYSPYAEFESPAFKPKPMDSAYAASAYGKPVPQVPIGERSWQQFGQGIGKHIYDNPMPYALGAGAAGLGLYGLHNMMQQPRRKRRPEEA